MIHIYIYLFIYLLGMFLADPYMLQKRPQPASLDPTVTAAAMIFLSPGEIVASSRALAGVGK